MDIIVPFDIDLYILIIIIRNIVVRITSVNSPGNQGHCTKFSLFYPVNVTL